MHIYLDETGPFVVHTSSGHSVSCAAALLVPESAHDRLLQQFATLKGQWGYGGTEVKGRRLNEGEFAAAIDLVFQTQAAFLRIAAIDMGFHRAATISAHQSEQARRLRESVVGPFTPELVADVHRLANETDKLAPQLYVESVLMTQLVVSVIQTGTFLYSQLEPAALGRFEWTMDAKDRTVTESEALWRTLLLPSVQSESLRRRTIFLTEGDYSHFAPFENPDLTSAPDHLRVAVTNPDEVFSSYSVNRVLADLRFRDSRDSLGLQLVDALANCFRRAVNGRLKPQGWQDLGHIIVRDPRTDLALELCALSPTVAGSNPIRKMPYGDVIRHIERSSRGYLLRRDSTP